MLKTIDGITLNTALATEVAHFSNGRERGDPLHVSETLYRQKQTWFLRRRARGREDLIPIMADKAQRWLREKNFIGCLAAHFGERVRRPQVSSL